MNHQIIPDLFTSDSDLENSSILGVPDYNGDGLVNFQDIFAVTKAAFPGSLLGKDAEIYDRNADGAVDFNDISETVFNLGRESSPLDRQLAEIHQEVRPYYSIFGFPKAIVAEQLFPVTGAFQGHGEHWASLTRIVDVLEKPTETLTHLDFIGFNVEPEPDAGASLFKRSVVGAFYLVKPDNLDELYENFIESAQDGDEEIHFGVPEYNSVPDLFKDDPLMSPHRENWHRHDLVYIHIPDPLNATTMVYEQNLTPQELYERYTAATQDDPHNEKVIWGIETGNGFVFEDLQYANTLFIPSFLMMHVWGVSNPGEDGIFGQTNPLISPDAPPLDSHHGDFNHQMMSI